MTDLDAALNYLDAAPEDVPYVPVQTPEQSELDRKINQHFDGVVVRKDLVKAVRGNAIVPGYVLEYLLGQYAATDDEATIQEGIENVRRILADHHVHRNEHMLIKATIQQKGKYRIIDRVSVVLNDKDDVYEASFENLQIGKVIIDAQTVKDNEKLLVSGVWCICDIEYAHNDSPGSVPWQLGSLKAIQIAGVDLDRYFEGRKAFATDEWIDVLTQSIGLNPEQFSQRGKLIALTRLIPFVERNYNLIELGPKGTGKSHTFSELSPNGILISGGEVTVAKLFVNNASGKIGLVGYWDCVAFDEFASNKKTDQNLVNVMKNYLANKSFSRGTSVYGADASMAFIGNTTHTVPFMLKNTDLFDELPPSYRDPAWLDRIHHYIPGWEVSPVRSEMFSSGYGFVVDYLAEVLHSLRSEDFSDKYNLHFTLDSSIVTRDQDGIRKTFSGLMKLIHPSGEATQEEIEELLVFSIEGRKRVKDQVLRIDATMRDNPPHFRYQDSLGAWREVLSLEEIQYPNLYRREWDSSFTDGNLTADDLPVYVKPAMPVEPRGSVTVAPLLPIPEDAVVVEPTAPGAPQLFEGFRDFQAGQKGVSYENLLLPWLVGAKKIKIVDGYIRMFHQGRNLTDLLSLLAVMKDAADELEITLETIEEENVEFKRKQLEMLVAIRNAAESFGIKLIVNWDATIHDRSISTDHGWRIQLGKGLDIWEKPSNAFAEVRQEFRPIAKSFTVNYNRIPTESD
jgi:ATP-dependent Lon protease